MKEEVLFVDLTFFGRTAEVANQYLRKGSKVLVEGRLKLDSWTDQNGGKRSKHSVTAENMTMLDSKGSTPGGEGGYTPPVQNSNPPQQQQNKQQTNSIPEIDINDNEIPF